LMISHSIVFCCVPRDRPAANAPTTPLLSEHDTIWQFVNFAVISKGVVGWEFFI
jgi:hypothetical protein